MLPRPTNRHPFQPNTIRNHKVKGVEKEKGSPTEGARLPNPPGSQGNIQVGFPNIRQALDRYERLAPICPYQGPQRHIDQWEALGADKVLLHGIRRGVQGPLHAMHLHKIPSGHMRSNHLPKLLERIVKKTCSAQ